MNSYTIYTHVSSITHDFACFVCAYRILQAQNIWIEDYFEISWIKEASKEGLKTSHHNQTVSNTIVQDEALKRSV